jgi:Predicted transcriptional regulators
VGSPVINNPKVRHQLAVTVRTMLRERDWSETELSRRSGVSQKHINNITREKLGCSVEGLHEIAKAFNVPAWQMLVWGRAASDANAQKLDKLVVAYLNADTSLRQVFDRLVSQTVAEKVAQ